MKIIGIVGEYNPFHRGHEYHISETKAAAPDCAVVVVMSGDFVQRGEPACFDKHIRARAAMLCGADLVVELPLPWAISSAESFARGAVGLLGALGVVDAISFGSEHGDIAQLDEVADALLDSEINTHILNELESGIPYAAARQNALQKTIGDRAMLIEQPNNILGVEYLKAIKTLGLNMTAMTVARKGAGHDKASDGEFRSASEIRSMMKFGSSWHSYVPPVARKVYSANEAIDLERFETALMSRLRWLDKDAFAMLPDASEGLENRIYKAVREGRTVEDILAKSKSRRYAMSRLRRMLICAATGVTAGMSSAVPGYARILAANSVGIGLLGEITDKCAVPVITKPAHGARLGGEAGKCFAITAEARDLYTLGMSSPHLRTVGSDWRTSPCMRADYN